MEFESIYLKDGRPLVLSEEDFLSKIINSDACFVCSKHYSETKFNREHVMPKWVLKKVKIFDQKVNIAQVASSKYRSYQVPCCVSCNDELGAKLEQPISKLFDLDYNSFVYEMNYKENIQMLYQWLCLIFFKSTIMDKNKNYGFDGENILRVGGDREWEYFHHFNSMCRMHYEEIDWGLLNPASIFFFKIENQKNYESNFNYAVLHNLSTIMLQIKDIGIVSCLDDGGASKRIFARSLVAEALLNRKKLDIFQFKEVMCHISFLSACLNGKPVFEFAIDKKNQRSILMMRYLNGMPFLDDDLDTDFHGDLRKSIWCTIFQEEIENGLVEHPKIR